MSLFVESFKLFYNVAKQIFKCTWEVIEHIAPIKKIFVPIIKIAFSFVVRVFRHSPITKEIQEIKDLYWIGISWDSWLRFQIC